jgi:Ca2+-binding RTX toxin-like protein
MGDGDDEATIDCLGGNGTIKGGTGDDLLLLDSRGNRDGSIVNTMDGSHLDWGGGEGNDSVEMYFVSTGTTVLNIVEDDMGSNQVIAKCSDEVCTVLSRSTFLVNIHNPATSESSYERINLSPTASITSFLLYLSEGENHVHFDDTFSTTTVIGGDDKDSFYIGQIYNVRL